MRLAPPISPSAKPGRPVTRCACVASRPKFAALISGPRSQTRPLPGFARHFAFSETGQAGHTLRVCCFAPKIRCAHFGAPLANPAPSARLKNADFCANEWQICIFLYASLRWFRTSERQKLWHFSNAHETARMTFVCSHPTDASKNDIGNRAGRDGVSGPHTGQHFAPRACGKALRRNNFPGNGRRAVGRSIPNPVFRHTRSV